jgi:hypothetical protein
MERRFRDFDEVLGICMVIMLGLLFLGVAVWLVHDYLTCAYTGWPACCFPRR